MAGFLFFGAMEFPSHGMLRLFPVARDKGAQAEAVL
jgi:hypothetical protein